MRLTLRTLLAYVDDILDPQDREELRQKIEASDFASELIHRSRDAVRRLRLGAPEIDAGDNDEVLGGDPSLDANAVAEYLDNTLPPEQVAEFERCCLETGNFADMRLAEVASCHHILTMVLGEPADIRPEVRQRMYGLAGDPSAAPTSGGEQLRIEPAHTPPSSGQNASTPVAAPPVASVVAEQRDHEVPDYLRAAARDRRRRTWFIAAGILVLVAGVGIGYFARPVPEPDLSVVDEDVAGNWEEGVEIGSRRAIDPESDSTVEAAADTPAETPGVADQQGEAPLWDADEAAEEAPAWSPPSDQAPAVAEADDQPTGDQPGEPAPAAAEPPLVPDAQQSPAEELDAAAADYRADASDTALPTDDQGNIVFDSSDFEDAAEPAGPGEGFRAPRADSTAARPSAPPLPEPDWDAPGDANAQTPTDEATTPAVAAADNRDDAAADSPSPESPPQADAEGPEATTTVLGKYPGEGDLLLIHVPASQRWLRLPGGTELAPGDRLLALPMFRSQIDLAGVRVILIDGTQAIMAPPEADQQSADAALEAVYGRLLLNADVDGSRVALAIGEQVHDLQLGASADLAVEIERPFVPGAASAAAGPLKVTWHLTSGQLGEGASAVEAPATWQTIDGTDSQPEAFEELPAWIDQPKLSVNEQEARERVAEALEAGQPVSIPLLELSDKRGLGRRREVRSLAARSGAHVGVFEPFVAALNDPDLNQLVWERQIESVREAMAQHPAAVEQLRKDFVAQRGEAAAKDLMEMMIGYDRQEIGETSEERARGALPRLIRWLDSDQLDYRVLALYNLNQITGTRNLGSYRPTYTAQQRQRALRVYWDRLEQDELRPRVE